MADWKPPERKPLNINPTRRWGTALVQAALDAHDREELYVPGTNALLVATVLADELLALQHGMEEMAAKWRDAYYTCTDGEQAMECAAELDKLREGTS